MYIPKKLKWDSLSDFKKFLERETSEKIVLFEGWILVTETTEYGIVDSQLIIRPKQEKIKKEEPKPVVARPKPAKKKKVEEPKPKTKEEILAEMKARGKKVLDKKKKK